VGSGFVFTNGVFEITFPDRHAIHWEREYGLQYDFLLPGAVASVPEFVVRPDVLKGLAGEVGLECIVEENFVPFIQRHLDDPKWGALKSGTFGALAKRLHTSDIAIAPEEWDICGLYKVYVFQAGDPGE